MKKLRNIIDAKLVTNKNDHLKWTSKQRYMSQKIVDNNLLGIPKNKVTLTLKKPANVSFGIDQSINVRIPL